MNLPAFLSLVGLVCYGWLIAVVVRQGLHHTGVVLRLFLANLIIMAVWAGTALAVSLARTESTAEVWYDILAAVVLGQFLLYTAFVRALLRVNRQQWTIWVGVLWWVVSVLLISGMRDQVIVDVSFSPQSHIYLPEFGNLAVVIGIPNYIFLIYAIVLLSLGWRHSSSALDRSRVRYLWAGLILVVLGTLANFVPLLKPYPIDGVTNVINALLIAYAIFRYQLLDISVVIRKGLLYSVPTVAVGVAYFLAISLAMNLLHTSMDPQVFLFSLVMAVVFSLLARPVRDGMQSYLDRLFFRENYDSGQMLQRLSRTVASVLDLADLTNMILDDIQRTMHVGSGAFFIRPAHTSDYVLTTQRGLDPAQMKEPRFRNDHPIVVWLSRHQTSLQMHEIDMSPDFKGLWEAERADLAILHAELFVPLLVRNELIGILCLGEKLSELPYAPEERLMISTLANQTAVAIENASLFSQTLAEKERTAAIVEQAFAGIVLLDGQLRIISLNPAAEAIVGRNQAHVIGAPASDVLGRSILDDRGSLHKAIATGERVAPKEVILIAGDRQREVLLGVTPLRDGYLLSLADVTQLKEVDRLKSDIVANVSHEFRTPLAIIKAYAELLMDDALGEVAASRHLYLGIIDAETDRLTGMVSGLLDLARLEAGRDAIVMAPIDLGEVITEVEEFLQPQALARDLTVNVAIACDLPPLQANRELLIAIVSNLLGNAIKFSRAGGRVDVVASRDGEFAILQVFDQGIGMSEDDLGHLFEKFYRGSVAKEAGIRGTGLGLVLAKEAAAAHGGKIAVTSQLGIGTCFTVSLPVGNSVGPAQYGDVSTGEAWVTDSLMSIAAGSLVGA